MSEHLRNITASIHDRLANEAKKEGKPFSLKKYIVFGRNCLYNGNTWLNL
jgi:hypothetical protein